MLRRLPRDRRGAVLVFVAVGAFVLLGLTGLALDGGMAFLTRAKLSRAADAASLAGARSIRQGQSHAEAQAVAVAAANGVVTGEATTLDIKFGMNEKLQQTVLVTARRTIPLLFSRVLGFNTMRIGAVAEATVPPIDLVLVVDRSGSLATENSWVPLQDAVKTFTSYFDDKIDQFGMESFQIRANDEVLLGFHFQGAVTSAINTMNSVGDTNTGEGLRLASEQFKLPNVRPGAAKVVVFFTDGRPTAFRGAVDGVDRIMAVGTTNTGRIRGYFDNPNGLSMSKLAAATGCANAATCLGWNEASIRNQARTNGLASADLIRSAGVYVYTIALGNPGATDPIMVPDLDYLRDIANENHRVSPTQPAGRSYFAPSAAELNAVFALVAKDLLVRLSR